MVMVAALIVVMLFFVAVPAAGAVDAKFGLKKLANPLLGYVTKQFSDVFFGQALP